LAGAAVGALVHCVISSTLRNEFILRIAVRHVRGLGLEATDRSRCVYSRLWWPLSVFAPLGGSLNLVHLHDDRFRWKRLSGNRRKWQFGCVGNCLHYLYLIFFEFSGCTTKEVKKSFHENYTTKRSNEMILFVPVNFF